MPILALTTNVKIPDTKAFTLEFSKLGADVLGKPEKYIAVTVDHKESFAFGGTTDPAFILYIGSLDNINPEVNEKYSKALFNFFKEKFGIPGDRGYINFVDPGRANWGYQGTTFATIFGSS